MGKNSKAFTFVEVMVVVTVIAILAGILLSALGTGREKVQINSTKTAMTGFLSTFVDVYNNDPDYAETFLTTQDSLSTTPYTNTAVVAIDGSEWADQKYIDFFQDGKYGSEKSLTDSWGNTFKFNLDTGEGEIKIKSFGPDGNDDSGNDDDIVMTKTL